MINFNFPLRNKSIFSLSMPKTKIKGSKIKKDSSEKTDNKQGNTEAYSNYQAAIAKSAIINQQKMTKNEIKIKRAIDRYLDNFGENYIDTNRDYIRAKEHYLREYLKDTPDGSVNNISLDTDGVPTITLANTHISAVLDTDDNGTTYTKSGEPYSGEFMQMDPKTNDCQYILIFKNGELIDTIQ